MPAPSRPRALRCFSPGVPLLLDDETGVPCALRVAGVQVGLDSVIKSLSCDPRHLSSHGVDGASGTVTRTTTVVQGPCDRRGRGRLDGSRPEGGHCAGGGGLSRNPATLLNAGPGPEPREFLSGSFRGKEADDSEEGTEGNEE